MDFTEGDPDEAYAALTEGRTIIVNGILAAQAGIKAGDTVTLSTPQGQMDYRVVAVGGDVLNMKINTAYISQAMMREDFNKTEDIFVQVNLAQGADPVAVEAAAEDRSWRTIPSSASSRRASTWRSSARSSMRSSRGCTSCWRCSRCRR